MLPESGDVIHITKAASVQFCYPFLFRVISVDPRPTYEGWAWIHGYELNSAGEAVERRELFVQVAGLRPHTKASKKRPAKPRQPVKQLPIPQQRTPRTPARRTR